MKQTPRKETTQILVVAIQMLTSKKQFEGKLHFS